MLKADCCRRGMNEMMYFSRAFIRTKEKKRADGSMMCVIDGEGIITTEQFERLNSTLIIGE